MYVVLASLNITEIRYRSKVDFGTCVDLYTHFIFILHNCFSTLNTQGYLRLTTRCFCTIGILDNISKTRYKQLRLGVEQLCIYKRQTS